MIRSLSIALFILVALPRHSLQQYNSGSAPLCVQTGACNQPSINPCSPNPCLNYGICSSNDGVTFRCTCSPNFSGVRCEKPVQTNPCQSNNCGQSSNPCENKPCQNGGTCVTSGSQNFICQCPVHYTGKNCEIYTPPRPVTTTRAPTPNPCLTNPCAQGSTCLFNIQSVNNPVFMCVCPPNTQGTLCNQPVNPCSKSPCKNGGTCVPINKVNANPPYACVCPNSHNGPTCENPVQQNLCPSNTCGQTNPCKNGGWWQNGYCLCPSKYTGKFCENQVQQNLCPSNNCVSNQNPCSNNPCQHGGTCIPIKEQNANPPFACVCPIAYTGLTCNILLATTTTTRSTTPANPCANNPCQNGRCIPITQPSSVQFVCICYPNYSGLTCNQFNPPVTTTTTTTTTQAPNPCLNRPCQNGGTCVNLNIANVAPFACLCTNEYSGNLCQNKLDTCGCLNGGTCRNGVCLCPVKYTGRKCETLVQQNPCQNNYCGNNYQFNPCSNNPCQNGGTCQVRGQSFICSCPVYYTGPKCEQYVQQNPCQSSYCGNKQSNDPCSSGPCKNGATCRSTGFGYQCDCVVGFVGNQCETRQFIDLCATNSCYNGGTCQTKRRGQDQYTVMCYCPPEYTGSRCQTKAGVTTTRQTNIPLPCQCLNSGVCRAGVCECPSNFYGSRCEFQRNFQTTTLATVQQEVKCPSGLCINGRCAQAPQGNGFFCVCNYGWTGTRCTIRNFCQTQLAQCQNGGICLNNDNGFLCKCRSGFTGKNCEIKQNEIQVINPCGQNQCIQTQSENNFCKNGGSPYSKNGNQMCQCPRGYLGLQCEVDICTQEKLIGPCKQSIPRYYYNSITKKCETFLFGGCDANENNFASLESCNFNCKDH